MKTTMYRQGDVLLRKVVSIPDNAKEKPVQQRIILARGEATGHAHVLEASRVQLFEDGQGNMWLQVNSRDAEIRHEEHATVHISRGIYQVVQQRTYSPEEIRKVLE